MGDDKLVITEAGFLTEFLNQHSQRTDRPFCFILGAGVSRSSGIPTYKQALEAEPSSHYVLASYADLLHQTGKDFDKAEGLYEKALEINPQSKYALGRFSAFMRDIRGDPERAEELARRRDAVK